MNSNSNIYTSNSKNPDLDWSQIRETILMINIAVAQLEFTMLDGNKSVDTLTESFTSIINLVKDIASQVKASPDKNTNVVVKKHCQAVEDKMSDAIVAFQFYDKLTQRLTHVSRSLSQLVDLVGDPNRLYSPANWHQLQENIKSNYTVAEDIKLFDAILNGASFEETMELMKNHREEGVEPEIELF